MKKSVVGIGAVIVIAGVAILALTLSHTHKTTTNGEAKANTTNSSRYTAIAACSVLTNGIASQILGSSAVKAATPADSESTSDIAFSNCAYSAGPNVDPPHMASVAVRSAKDSTGASSNKSVFTASGRPAGVQTVHGYGDAAYWDPSMGQLNVLKGNNLYILTNYTGTSPANGSATLAQAEQLAQVLKFQ